jgi:cardiolipin synthase
VRFSLLRWLRSRRARAARDASDLRYFPARGGLRSRNLVTPLRAGEQAFPAMLEAIARAERSVCLEMYILRADRIGQRFQAALIERARAGVHVRVIYDAVGSIGLPAKYVGELTAAGVQLIEFHPVMPWRPRAGWNRRDHKKLLIVDCRVAFTGGINIGDEYCPAAEGGGVGHDLCAQIEGPAVSDLLEVFAATWHECGGSRLALPKRPAEPPESPDRGLSWVEVIANLGVIARPRIRRAVLHAMDRAEKRILILNAYFIPDAALRRAFARAIGRGVEVSVIVPSRSDLALIYFASRKLYARLMRSGVRIFEWQGEMMHAKAAAIDGVWATVGSYNLDRRSFIHNLEVGLLIVDRDLARELETQFEADLLRCREVDARVWSQRPAWQKWLEGACYALRYWL